MLIPTFLDVHQVFFVLWRALEVLILAEIKRSRVRPFHALDAAAGITDQVIPVTGWGL